jgi:enolase
MTQADIGKTVTRVFARQIFDSRGNPTVEVEVTTGLGVFRAAVPSGASTGVHEALELRDGDPKICMGKGVSKAIHNVNSILGPLLVQSKLSVACQTEIDALLTKADGTEKKSKLGANAILGISMAVARAGAAFSGVPLYEHLAAIAGKKVSDCSLPCPAFNVINGGAHALSNPIAFQEFMVMPTGAASFSEAMRMGSEVYHHLKKILVSRGYDTQIGDEGGFAPKLASPAETLAIIQEAIKAAGHTGKIHLALDVAASEFYDSVSKFYDLDQKTKLPLEQHKRLTGEQLLEEYRKLKAQFPDLISIEDPYDQDDWSSWSLAAKELSGTQIVADDLTVTSIPRIEQAIQCRAANALLLKINQIGTITESIQAAQLVQSKGWGLMISHRSGETEDTFIADLSVALGAGQIKSGAPCRSERLAKYNQLLRIEEALSSRGVKYAGFPRHC